MDNFSPLLSAYIDNNIEYTYERFDGWPSCRHFQRQMPSSPTICRVSDRCLAHALHCWNSNSRDRGTHDLDHHSSWSPSFAHVAHEEEPTTKMGILVRPAINNKTDLAQGWGYQCDDIPIAFLAAARWHLLYLCLPSYIEYPRPDLNSNFTHSRVLRPLTAYSVRMMWR